MNNVPEAIEETAPNWYPLHLADRREVKITVPEGNLRHNIRIKVCLRAILPILRNQTSTWSFLVILDTNTSSNFSLLMDESTALIELNQQERVRRSLANPASLFSG